jgi:hypothetical protein
MKTVRRIVWIPESLILHRTSIVLFLNSLELQRQSRHFESRFLNIVCRTDRPFARMRPTGAWERWISDEVRDDRDWWLGSYPTRRGHGGRVRGIGLG